MSALLNVLRKVLRLRRKDPYEDCVAICKSCREGEHCGERGPDCGYGCACPCPVSN